MLYKLAALLLTSAALGSVTGVDVVPPVDTPETDRLGVVAVHASVDELPTLSLSSVSTSAIEVSAAPVSSAGSSSAVASSAASLDAAATTAATTVASTADSAAVPTSGSASFTSSRLMGPLPRLEYSRLATLSGSALLRQLVAQPAADIARYFAEHPDAAPAILAAPPSASTVTMWWKALPLGSQSTLAIAAPQLVGNLNGIPFTTRDVANRSFLSITLADVESRLAEGVGRAESLRALERIASLERIRDALGDGFSHPRRYLLSLDVEGEPTVAIAIGDPEEADYVSVLVPGMFFSAGQQVAEWTDVAARVHDEQTAWLRLLGESDAFTENAVSTIAWIGYQTPHLLNVGSLDLAYEGRDALTGLVNGIQSSRGLDQPYLSLLTHSYGSTAALMALTDGAFWVDALAVVGSPGSDAQSVDELNVRDGNVFVGEADWDPIPNSAYFGSDPGAADYGAKRMSVAGTVDVITNEVLAGSLGHNEYFGAGTESLRNIALVGIGQGALVTDGSPADSQKTIALAR